MTASELRPALRSPFVSATAKVTAILALTSGLVVPALPATAQGVEVTVTLRTDPGRPLGTDGNGRVLMYAPNPLEPGSSTSHWDPSATPDLLMEPSASPFLSFAPLDLTQPAMRDLGWRPGSSNITLRVQDPAGMGFNDPELGAQRMAAMQFVAQRWGQVLDSDVEINLGVRFSDLPCSENSGVLAQAGTQFIFESFPGAPVQNTWFHGALAESLAGQNLSLEDNPSPNAPDIIAQFNSQIDEDCLGGNTGFYYALDGNAPQGRISFVNVALHEVGHGLGFASISNPDTGAFFMGLPDIFDRNLFDIDLGLPWHRTTAEQRVASRINTGRLVWNGPRANGAAPDFLDPGLVLTVDDPPALAGTSQVAPAAFGPPITSVGLQGRLALGRDGSADPTLGCNPLVNSGEVAGKIAVLDRGTCFFFDKARNAQNAGAIALVVVNNVPSPPIPLGLPQGESGASITIPAVHLSQQDGERLKRALTVGLPPAAPSSLTAQPLPGGRGLLGWTDNSDNENAFRIERRRDGAGGFQLRTTTGPDVTSFEDSGLAAGVTYSYRVRAQNAAGASAFSNVAALTVGADPPPAPNGLRASTLSDTDVILMWDGTTGAETGFVVERRRVGSRTGDGGFEFDEGPFETAAEAPAGATQVVLGDLEPGTTYNLRLQAVNENGGSPFAGPVAATTETATPPAPCVEGGRDLCLLDDRFQVQAMFKDPFNGGATGFGTAVPFSSDSGLYWFFNPDNIELITKMIDARTLTDSFWFFYGALSSVEYWIVVTDTDGGQVRTYYNPPRVLGAEADTRAFLVLEPQPQGLRPSVGHAGDAIRSGVLELPASPPVPVAPLTQAGTAGGDCQPDTTTLCLLDDRFRVTVDWSNPRAEGEGSSGQGMALPLEGNDTTGTFWFFRAENLELLVKMIDATSFNGKFWVFFGGLTDLPYTLRVEDTVTGNFKQYENPFGDLIGETDTAALDPE